MSSTSGPGGPGGAWIDEGDLDDEPHEAFDDGAPGGGRRRRARRRRWPWILLLIIVNLIILGSFYDVALRDFGLLVGSLALNRLAQTKQG